ncbi:hypothetical protein EVAR_95029_1 [Eumeta japonica]|uniref:Uncharacterized protein n=1 Tax=Eumeta variegata TaxID=151549 RepID=A0A4C1VU49_EUMVA|nr:hypothetical protein EVAR_95029_1 [Eumeta japonica]
MTTTFYGEKSNVAPPEVARSTERAGAAGGGAGGARETRNPRDRYRTVYLRDNGQRPRRLRCSRLCRIMFTLAPSQSSGHGLTERKRESRLGGIEIDNDTKVEIEGRTKIRIENQTAITIRNRSKAKSRRDQLREWDRIYLDQDRV